MKRMLLSVMTLIVVCLSSSISFAVYSVEFWHVQHRIYEDGEDFNRAGFCVKDDGNFVVANIVQSATLFHPDGSEVTLTGGGFSTYKVLYGNYQANSNTPGEGQWSFDNDFHTENYYALNFNEPLQIGQYRLEVTLQGDTGSPHILYRDFNGLVGLPILSSSSFRGYIDGSGNGVWMWDPPQEVEFWMSGAATSVRAYISIFNGGQYVGDLWVRQPTHLGILIVPSNVMQKLEAEGDALRVQVQLRTNDDNNRAYSNGIFTDKLKKDINKVVVIPLL